MKLRLGCKEVSRLVSDGLDERQPAHLRARIRLHYMVCASCSNLRKQMDFLRKATRALGDQPPTH